VQARAAGDAARVIRGGGLVVYPTDTVYGLGVDPENQRAVQRVYEVKGRPDAKAIIWLLADLDDARAWCHVDERAERLANRFWPGGLTLVLRRVNPQPGDLDTLGVRIPNHPAALAIIRAVGKAVATTSANRSGEPSARTADEAVAQLGAQVDLVVDAGAAPGGTESTVLDLTADPPALLRPGAIGREAIEGVLGVVLRTPGA
jgi:L-threonylcarbamoyladenylate synthase